MTTHPSALTVIRRHLARLGTRQRENPALGYLAAAGIDLDGSRHRCTVEADSPLKCTGSSRSQALDALAALAPADEVAALGAVVVIGPELARMARLVAGRPLDRSDAESELVAIAWELVTQPRDPEQPWRSATLLNAIWTQARRSAGLRRRGHIDFVPLDDDLDRAVAEVDPLERWPGLLAAAVARGVLTPREVVLIAQTRMEGRPLTEVADALGRRYDAARKERDRAEAALREFALSQYPREWP